MRDVLSWLGPKGQVREVKREGRGLWLEGMASGKLRDREGGRMCRQTDEQVG